MRDSAVAQIAARIAAIAARSTARIAAVELLVAVVARDTAIASIENIALRARRRPDAPLMRAAPSAGLAAAGGAMGWTGEAAAGAAKRGGGVVPPVVGGEWMVMTERGGVEKCRGTYPEREPCRRPRETPCRPSRRGSCLRRSTGIPAERQTD